MENSIKNRALVLGLKLCDSLPVDGTEGIWQVTEEVCWVLHCSKSSLYPCSQNALYTFESRLKYNNIHHKHSSRVCSVRLGEVSLRCEV